MEAFPVSLSRTFCTGRAEPPPPGISGHPRRIGPVSDAQSCRSNSDARRRSSRMPFFLTPIKPDDPGLRIAEYPLDRCLWTKPGEPIFVQQSPDFFHPVIIRIFLLQGKLFSPYLKPCYTASDPLVYPHSSTMNHFVFLTVSHHLHYGGACRADRRRRGSGSKGA